jgi:YidC/Oxa1 family membrane protein insertase
MDRTRIILAMALSLLVLIGWPIIYSAFFAPPPVQPPPGEPAAVTESKPPVTAQPASASPEAALQPSNVPARAPLKIITRNWEVTLSSQGAVATSWILHIAKGNGEPVLAAASTKDNPIPLELIPQASDSNPDIRMMLEKIGRPLSMRVPGDENLSAAINRANFEVRGAAPDENVITLGDGESRSLEFITSVGGVTARKAFTFYGDRLVLDARAEVVSGAQVQPVQLVMGPGIGDQTNLVIDSYSTPPQAVAYNQAEGDAEYIPGLQINQELGSAGQQWVDKSSSGYRWAGVGDHYFTMVGITQPADPARAVAVSDYQIKLPDPNLPARDYPALAFPVNALGAEAPTYVFVGPREREVLGRLSDTFDTDMGALIDYGFFSFLVRPLIPVLDVSFNFFARLFNNYGWAIVATTILLNLALSPLRYTSTKKMRKAAKHQPRMKELQEKMKKLKENPKKYERELQQLQQEQLALMKEANPLGGCLPLLLQFPIFWAIYLYLGSSLDVRHSPWLLWLNDLSRPDPYYILPLVMCGTMIASTKLTPTPAVDDPAMKMQRALMIWVMPIMLTYFFFFSAPSGLVLYWMVSNIVGVAVQVWINKRLAEPAEAPSPTTGKTGAAPSDKPGGRRKQGKQRGKAEVGRV